MLFFEYVAERSQYYRRMMTLLAFLCTTSIVFIVYVTPWLGKSLSDFSKSEIVVSRVFKGTIQVRSGAALSSKDWVLEDALIIETLSGKFYIDNTYDHHWTKLSNSIKTGNKLVIHYQVENGNREVVQLTQGNKTLMSLDERKKAFPYVFSGLVALTVVIMWCMFKLFKARKTALSKGWT